MINLVAIQDRFIQIYKSNIHRKGSDELLAYLQTSSFLCDPASSKYHLAEEGGLVLHSVNVWKRLHWLCNAEATYSDYSVDDESIAIVGLLHDLCKVGTYIYDYTGDKLKFSKNDTFPFGHGEKSVYIINKFMTLTEEEAMAIRYHMGSWNEWEKSDASAVFKKYPLALLAHMADEFATFVDEEK